MIPLSGDLAKAKGIKSDAKDASESDSSVDVDSKTDNIPEDSE